MMEYVTIKTTLKHVHLMVEIVATVEILIGTPDVNLTLATVGVRTQNVLMEQIGVTMEIQIDVRPTVTLHHQELHVGLTASEYVTNVFHRIMDTPIIRHLAFVTG